MGAVCARCNEVQKSQGDNAPRMRGAHTAEMSDEASADGSDGDHSEVAASSEDDHNQEEYKQGVEEILKSTGKNLKRGKTMAMKEAISTAKKYGLETSKISEAEKKLDEHKKQQKREEAEREVDAFFNSAACKDLAMTEKMLKKVKEADCSEKVIKRVQDSLEELILTRDLEDEERSNARELLKQSCRDFILAATKAGGRQVTLLSLDDGQKIAASIAVDPPLLNLTVRTGASSVTEVPVGSLSVVAAKNDKKVSGSRGFKVLGEEECDCAVAVRYQVDRTSGVFCFVEPTRVRRDRLLEAFVVLAVAGR
mmetsp:Transcript_99082/g.248407  ORF Transcript_99082/g.248407 Transcript_99082/m.248407 type:complete len:310 (-) Transcript_99082:239-1168(-)